jgi:hypothetical protein
MIYNTSGLSNIDTELISVSSITIQPSTTIDINSIQTFKQPLRVVNMKSVIASAILMATGAQACIRVHASMWSSGTFHDVMTVDVWDNNDFHCQMDQTKSGVSAATRWDFECNGDRYYKVTLWDNGGNGVIEHKVSGKS